MCLQLLSDQLPVELIVVRIIEESNCELQSNWSIKTDEKISEPY